MIHWREAMATALYRSEGFFTRTGAAPAAHFRTSALASPLFAAAIARLLGDLDAALGHPDPLDLVDIGAGGGELLTAILAAVADGLRTRLRPVAVELAPAPPEPGPVRWRRTLPEPVTGLLLATEWLDNVPVEVAQVDPEQVVRYVLVDPATGEQSLGEPVTGADADWLARWWPLREPGSRAEIGRTRDVAWAQAVAAVGRGAALAVDYGHLAPDRPPFGTLTGFRAGREVTPVPDGSCDLTAHVAMDAVAHAGRFALRTDTPAAAEGASAGVRRAKAGAKVPPADIVTQAEALRALGIDGARPPLDLARSDPTTYLRRLADASTAGELTDPSGLGAHYWLWHPAALPHPLRPFVAR